MSVEVVLVHLVLVPVLKPGHERCALFKLDGWVVRLKHWNVEILEPVRFDVVPAYFNIRNVEMSEQHRIG
jgi:hypothetical protein